MMQVSVENDAQEITLLLIITNFVGPFSLGELDHSLDFYGLYIFKGLLPFLPYFLYQLRFCLRPERSVM